MEKENIFVMDENRATHQDIRAINIAILNLMPLKEDTELQLLRSLSNTPLQVDVTFVAVSSHESKNTSMSHLNKFYETFADIKNRYFDGLIITGAPVEQMEYEEVDYWKEMCEIFEWSKTHATSTLHLCWGAQAGLYYHYGLKKYLLPEKKFGVYEHHVMNRKLPVIDYESMLEMSSCGSKVLALRCVEYAQRFDMPLHVRSSFSHRRGTLIVPEDVDPRTLPNI